MKRVTAFLHLRVGMNVISAGTLPQTNRPSTSKMLRILQKMRNFAC